MSDHFKSLDDYSSINQDGFLAQAIADGIRFWFDTITTVTEYSRANTYAKLGRLLYAFSQMCENEGGEDFGESVMLCIEADDPIDCLHDVISDYTSALNEDEIASSDLPDMLTRLRLKSESVFPVVKSEAA